MRWVLVVGVLLLIGLTVGVLAYRAHHGQPVQQFSTVVSEGGA